MIVIIDYGAGNIRSVCNAVAALGYRPLVTDNPHDIDKADALILPGVGAAGDTMRSLTALKFVDPLTGYISGGRPFLGICIGLQVLFDRTEEGGGHNCLGVYRGRVSRFTAVDKIPHMGWNRVKQRLDHAVFRGIESGSFFYFVHSYYAVPEDETLIAGETEYGADFCSVIADGNLVATQFHPEKSGEAGLRFLGNFIRFALGTGDGANPTIAVGRDVKEETA